MRARLLGMTLVAVLAFVLPAVTASATPVPAAPPAAASFQTIAPALAALGNSMPGSGPSSGLPGQLQTEIPTISGTVEVGKTLTVFPGTWEPAPVEFEYQWYRAGIRISDAFDPEYLVGPEDLGHRLSVEVLGIKTGYLDARVLSVETAPVLPSSLSSPTPTISGTTSVGMTLQVVTGAWDPTLTDLSYQWYRGDDVSPGATGISYPLTHLDGGYSMRVKVTGYVGGVAYLSKFSAPTAQVDYGYIPETSTPRITGTAKVGHKLRTDTGVWTGQTHFTFQWYHSGRPIPGATDRTYAPGPADVGKALRVKVTGSMDWNWYRSVTKKSALTAPVAKGTLATSKPRIAGVRQVGKQVKAVPGPWTSGTRFTYQWFHAGKAIKGATGQTHRQTAADAGTRLRVRITGSKPGYASKVRHSDLTAVVVRGKLSASVPKITGTTQVGKTLKATVGSWTSGTRLRYQWLRSGTAIKGATGQTHKLTTPSKGHTIKVRITGSKPGYAQSTRTSKATTRIR